jgi:cupin 2 domain-containing protein
VKNLFQDIPQPGVEEFSETLAQSGEARVERIVSRGHRAPAAGWFDQDRHEWVALLQGAAQLQFEDGSELRLGPGDWLEIPAHCRHRVAWTDPDRDTVWLAVHYR